MRPSFGRSITGSERRPTCATILETWLCPTIPQAQPPCPGAMLLTCFRGPACPSRSISKADGLSGAVKDAFAGADIDWFAFDMSGPETVRYAAAGLPFFTRHSDVEPFPILYEQAAGVWLDSFGPCWFGPEDIRSHLRRGKRVCVVSPELHGRPHHEQWEMLRSLGDDATPPYALYRYSRSRPSLFRMIEAVIFDMDGVLIDAKEWHYAALNRALRLFGVEISLADHLTNF